MTLNWNDKFSVGNETLDQDHKTLINLINKLQWSIEGGYYDQFMKIFDELELEVTGECIDNKLSLTVVNKRKSWTEFAKSYIYRVSSKSAVARRKLKLKTGQASTFKFSLSNVEADGLGLWIEPT